MYYDAKDYLSQREPFLFADKFTIMNGIITGTKHCDSQCIFMQKICSEHILPKMIMLEMLIQCGGAGYSFLNGSKKLFYLTTVKKVKMKKELTLPSDIVMKITTTKIYKKVFWQEGRIYCQDKLILKATWSCTLASAKQC